MFQGCALFRWCNPAAGAGHRVETHIGSVKEQASRRGRLSRLSGGHEVCRASGRLCWLMWTTGSRGYRRELVEDAAGPSLADGRRSDDLQIRVIRIYQAWRVRRTVFSLRHAPRRHREARTSGVGCGPPRNPDHGKANGRHRLPRRPWGKPAERMQ